MNEPHTHGGTDAPECTTCTSVEPVETPSPAHKPHLAVNCWCGNSWDLKPR